ncbi:DUF2914 domain-containing protein [Antarcticibacterium arcticum]|uniref:DUF2914 domain-containing protein n=1 Tax=Antarcticibacterium arcticum TaxID=2585771 RepID=A0A5B8YMM0_9FLAO|nr:DUF2914 domain-containing protein [Antarcticibacterium arcticum]QED38984.1 DUF2914 domain-containing protein [Antarcticibacterium arcticum]
MKRALVRYKKSAFGSYVTRNQKYAPILFFIGGFIFDTLTLGRIDRVYDTVVLCSHMTLLSITLYFFNTVNDDRWEGTFMRRHSHYLPLAIQFFFGALSSAFVIYFFRSVSMSKTLFFFILLVLLLFANEFLKRKISNKYLQFSIYFFISFTFFAFMIPTLIKVMNTFIFIISGLVSLWSTLALIRFIYRSSPVTRAEISLKKLIGLILSIYITINVFYYYNLIPPVPLAMDTGMVAHNVQRINNEYIVTYENNPWYIFWRKHDTNFHRQAGQRVYVFTSVFAPTALKKSIFHRWKWYNPETKKWEVTDDISFKVTGGRDLGFRGYTYKTNLKEGQWKVDVITEEELVLGVVDFVIKNSSVPHKERLVKKTF